MCQLDVPSPPPVALSVIMITSKSDHCFISDIVLVSLFTLATVFTCCHSLLFLLSLHPTTETNKLFFFPLHPQAHLFQLQKNVSSYFSPHNAIILGLHLRCKYLRRFASPYMGQQRRVFFPVISFFGSHSL